MSVRSTASAAARYVGTIVGESTSSEFRLAVAQEAVREQDLIAVDAELRRQDDSGASARIRVWAKVQRIERMNPLFPSEAGHELAATLTDPFDTVLSLSREMVTAVCQVLGAEAIGENRGGKLDHLRYPAQPATSAYRPETRDIARIVLGDLQEKQGRALDIATLANRPGGGGQCGRPRDRHAPPRDPGDDRRGKSWTARRMIEQLAA